MSFTVTASFDIQPRRVQDLIVCAFEGGSNYWLGRGRVELESPPYESLAEEGVVWYGRDDNVFARTDFKISINHDDLNNEDVKKNYYLDFASAQKGLELMAEKYPRHFNDLLQENEDAETGDVFLQLCLFQEVVYG